MNIILMRVLVIAVALVIWFRTQKIIARKMPGVGDIGDAVHRITANWHRYFAEHGRAADWALIVSSLCIDAFAVTLLASAVFGPRFAPCSGHTALAVLGAIGICHIAPWWLGAAAVIIALGEAIIVLVLRAHWTMDVITGAFAAWVAADLAARLAPFVDGWLRL